MAGAEAKDITIQSRKRIDMYQPRRNTLAYLLRRRIGRFGRFLLHRRGDGVHSPYAFHLISKVLRNPHPFTSFARLREQTKSLREKLKASYQDLVVSDVKLCELVFRLVHHHGKGAVLLLSDGESLLPLYLEATGQVEKLYRAMDKSVPLRAIIVENADAEELERLPQAILHLVGQRRDLMLLYYKHNPRMRLAREALLGAISPDILIDQGDFDICIWGKRLTPCKHFAYY